MLSRKELKAEFAKEGLDFEAEERNWDFRLVMSFNMAFKPQEAAQMRLGDTWIPITLESTAFMGDNGPVVAVRHIGLVPLIDIRKADPETVLADLERMLRGEPLWILKA